MSKHLLFLPGASGDPAYWRPLAAKLPSSWEKRCLGWPGLGNQPPEPKIGNLDDLVELAASRLFDEPTDVLAQSMGGVVALRLALLHPGRIRRLVLAATSGGIDLTGLGCADWRPIYRRDHPHGASWITEVRADHTAELHAVTQPALLLWGDADPLSPLAVAHRLETLLPRTELVIVPGGDHGFVKQHPELICESIIRHLQ